MDFDRDKIVAAFLAESEEGLERTEQYLIATEANPENAELLDEMFRVAHTLKGNAAALEFAELAGFAHVMEDLLEAIRSRRIAISGNVIAVLLHAVDALRAMVPAAAEGNGGLSPSHRELQRLMAAHAAEGPAPASPYLANVSEVPSPAAVPGNALPNSRNRTLRVDTQKLDEMLNLTGEIAIAQGRIRRMIAELPGEQGRRLLEMQRESEALQKDLQERVMGARLVPVGPLFQQFARSVRDISQNHNKLARLEISGADVEVDTRVLENLKDPLLHMIRNAIDHGIEMPEVRHTKGKNPCGLLKLSASHSAGNIVIQLFDDGAGFNRERILAKARTLNLVSDDEKVPDQELFNFVLMPGFSTADHVSDLSGRGVGMDVVRRNIDLLRGTIEIRSTEEQCATICIRLPLTLAIIEGFSVAANNETYVIPLELINECIELPREQISTEKSGVVNLRGEPLPFLRLRQIFGDDGAASPARENIVVLRHEEGLAGIAVDKLLGECQAIIKPLSRVFRDVGGVSGSTILDDGRVALILDVSTLLREFVAERVEALA